MAPKFVPSAAQDDLSDFLHKPLPGVDTGHFGRRYTDFGDI